MTIANPATSETPETVDPASDAGAGYDSLGWHVSGSADLSQLLLECSLSYLSPLTSAHFLTIAGLGRLGVDLFFVLSGFLITGILLYARNQPKYYKKFYVRRALRIFPAYLLIIFVLIVSHHVPYSFIALSVAYLSNLSPFFGVPMAYPVLWSLAVEEHFYFLWPFVVRHVSKVVLMAVCIGIVVLSPISRLIGYYIVMRKGGFDTYQFHQYTWNALDGLACGATLSIWLNGYVVARRTLIILSYALLVAAVVMWGTLWPFELRCATLRSGRRWKLSRGILRSRQFWDFFC